MYFMMCMLHIDQIEIIQEFEINRGHEDKTEDIHPESIRCQIFDHFHTKVLKVYHLPQIFNASDIESILRCHLSKSSVKSIINEYSAQLASGTVLMGKLANLTDPPISIDIIRLFLHFLGYLSLPDGTKSNGNVEVKFKGIALSDELRARFSTGFLPVSYILQFGEVLADRLPDVMDVGDWTREKDLLLYKQSMLHFFSWKSLLSDKVCNQDDTKLLEKYSDI